MKVHSQEGKIRLLEENFVRPRRKATKDNRSLLQSSTFWSLFFSNLLKNSIEKCSFTTSENSPVRSTLHCKRKFLFSSSSFKSHTRKKISSASFGSSSSFGSPSSSSSSILKNLLYKENLCFYRKVCSSLRLCPAGLLVHSFTLPAPKPVVGCATEGSSLSMNNGL